MNELDKIMRTDGQAPERPVHNFPEHPEIGLRQQGQKHPNDGLSAHINNLMRSFKSYSFISSTRETARKASRINVIFITGVVLIVLFSFKGCPSNKNVPHNKKLGHGTYTESSNSRGISHVKESSNGATDKSDQIIEKLKSDTSRTIQSICGVPFGSSENVDGYLSGSWSEMPSFGNESERTAQWGLNVKCNGFRSFSTSAKVQVSKKSKSIFRIVIPYTGRQRLVELATNELTDEGLSVLKLLEDKYGVKAIDLNKKSHFNIRRRGRSNPDKVYLFPLGKTTLYLTLIAGEECIEVIHDDWLSQAVEELSDFKQRYQYEDFENFATGSFLGLTFGDNSPKPIRDNWDHDDAATNPKLKGLHSVILRVGTGSGNFIRCRGICALTAGVTWTTKRIAKIEAEFYVKDISISQDEEFNIICNMVEQKLQTKPARDKKKALFKKGNITVAVENRWHIVFIAYDNSLCDLAEKELTEWRKQYNAKRPGIEAL